MNQSYPSLIIRKLKSLFEVQQLSSHHTALLLAALKLLPVAGQLSTANQTINSLSKLQQESLKDLLLKIKQDKMVQESPITDFLKGQLKKNQRYLRKQYNRLILDLFPPPMKKQFRTLASLLDMQVGYYQVDVSCETSTLPIPKSGRTSDQCQLQKCPEQFTFHPKINLKRLMPAYRQPRLDQIKFLARMKPKLKQKQKSQQQKDKKARKGVIFEVTINQSTRQLKIEDKNKYKSEIDKFCQLYSLSGKTKEQLKQKVQHELKLFSIPEERQSELGDFQ